MGMSTGIFLKCGYGDGDYSTLPKPYPLPSLISTFLIHEFFFSHPRVSFLPLVFLYLSLYKNFGTCFLKFYSKAIFFQKYTFQNNYLREKKERMGYKRNMRDEKKNFPNIFFIDVISWYIISVIFFIGS
jgi:hypothetical protein